MNLLMYLKLIDLLQEDLVVFLHYSFYIFVNMQAHIYSYDVFNHTKVIIVIIFI